MALLHALNRLLPTWQGRIAAAHLNHGLRGDRAEQDAAFAERTAQKMNIPFFKTRKDVNRYRKTERLSLEEAARIVRYDFLIHTAVTHGYPKIAMGHHADDNAELILMNIVRGSGLTGLGGMPIKRPAREDASPAGNVMIIRPLLLVTKKEILTYLETNRMPWRTDETNRDNRHLRNRIRNRLLPTLQNEYNPGIVSALNRLASLASGDNDTLMEMVHSSLEEAAVAQSANRLTLSVPRLAAYRPPVLRRVLRLAVEKVKGNLRKIGFDHIAAIVALCQDCHRCKYLDLPDRIRVERTAEIMVIEKSAAPLRHLPHHCLRDSRSDYSYPVTVPGEHRLPDVNARVITQILSEGFQPNFSNAGHLTAFFDMETLCFPLIIRNILPGDTFYPLGAGGRQKVKKFFIDHKVSAQKRRMWPLLTSNDQIAWVMGQRLDERFKITESTQTILKVELKLA